MNDIRTFKLKTASEKNGDIVYWMSRDQRAEDNWALIQAYNSSIERKVQLFVVFAMTDRFLGAGLRQFDFMINGLRELSESLKKLNIHFKFLRGNPSEALADFVNKNNIAIVYTDFDPLRIKRLWKKDFADLCDVTIYETDAHNIVPCRIASDKLEFAAYTIRNKINRRLPDYLSEFPIIAKHPYNKSVNNIFPDIDMSIFGNEPSVSRFFIPGEAEAKKRLKLFVEKKLNDYSELRNDPANNFLSDLSPYLHFGQLSAQRVALEVQKSNAKEESKDSYLEELIVRRELSDNFCFYNPNYDKFEGFHQWAMTTLTEHIDDKRVFLYSKEDFEKAKTHDKFWNAAQIEMVKTGKMHGYMRMYWAKKILEWSKTPHEALETAIYLNDKYQLDGRDPNGYTGIAWSIGGVHDRAWTERPIFGKIRYMNDKGLERKFEINEYVRRVNLII